MPLFLPVLHAFPLSLPQCSPEDVLNPVDVQISFSFEGVPIQAADHLAPQLDTRSRHVTDHKVPTDSSESETYFYSVVPDYLYFAAQT